jgi:hypothetical protein
VVSERPVGFRLDVAEEALGCLHGSCCDGSDTRDPPVWRTARPAQGSGGRPRLISSGLVVEFLNDRAIAPAVKCRLRLAALFPGSDSL